MRPAPPPDPVTPEDIERDRNVRQRLEDVFGFSADAPGQAAREHVFIGAGNVQHVRSQELDDARLARDLRAAGLI